MTGIGHGQPHKVPGRGFRMAFDIKVVDLGEGRGDGEGAAAGHGIAGVDRQVDEDLFHHAGIGMNRRQFLHQDAVKGDLFPDERANDFRQVVNDIIQVEQLRLHHLFSTEHE
jgi:hypothetical protein